MNVVLYRLLLLLGSFFQYFVNFWGWNGGGFEPLIVLFCFDELFLGDGIDRLSLRKVLGVIVDVHHQCSSQGLEPHATPGKAASSAGAWPLHDDRTFVLTMEILRTLKLIYCSISYNDQWKSDASILS